MFSSVFLVVFKWFHHHFTCFFVLSFYWYFIKKVGMIGREMWGWGKLKGVFAQMFPTASQKASEEPLRLCVMYRTGPEEANQREITSSWMAEWGTAKTVKLFLHLEPHNTSVHSCLPDLSHKQAKAWAGPSPPEHKELWSRYVVMLFNCFTFLPPNNHLPSSRTETGTETVMVLWGFFCFSFVVTT